MKYDFFQQKHVEVMKAEEKTDEYRGQFFFVFFY